MFTLKEQGPLCGLIMFNDPNRETNLLNDTVIPMYVLEIMPWIREAQAISNGFCEVQVRA